MNPDPQDVNKIIETAIDALKRGDTVNVTRLARQAASIAPDSEVAWLLLATVARPEDSLAFIHEALQINPESEAAHEALLWAQGRLRDAPAKESPPAMEAILPSETDPGSPAETPGLPEETSPLQGWVSSELQNASLPPADETISFDGSSIPPAPPSVELDADLESPADEPAIYDEADPKPALLFSELQPASLIPINEPVVFEYDIPQPVEPSTDLEAAPEISMDTMAAIDEALQPPDPVTAELESALELPALEPEFLDETSPSQEGEEIPEPSTQGVPSISEEPARTNRIYTTAPPPRQMHETIHPASLRNSRSPADQRGKRSVFSTVLIFLVSALAVVVIAALLGFTFLRPQVTSLWESIFPLEGCRASLVIGSQNYLVWPIKPGRDGTYDVPDNQPGRAYYVEGTSGNYVFFLSSVSENQSFMSGLQIGEPGTVTWSNCNTNTYHLFQPVAQVLDLPFLLDQSVHGITIIVPWPGSTSGFVLKGVPENILMPVITTPDAALSTIAPQETPDETSMPINITGLSGFLTEISLLETVPSADLTTIRVGISINNYGNLSGRLTTSDFSLTPAGGTPLALLQSEPALPLELAPGTTQTLSLTFPRPATAMATLIILNVEFDLEGY